MRHSIYIVYAVALLATLLSSGCDLARRSQRSTDTPTAGAGAYAEARLRSLLASPTVPTSGEGSVLRGAINLQVQLGKETFSSKVNTTIQRGQGIYWSIVPFPLVEAGRVWFTPEGITAVDRIHGRYAEASYAELSDYLGFPLSYPEVEALLLGHPFLPKAAKERRAEDLIYRAYSGGGAELSGHLRPSASQGAQRYTYRWGFGRTGYAELFDVWHQEALRGRVFALRYTAPSSLLPERTELYLGRELEAAPRLVIDWGRVQPYAGTPPSLKPQIKPSYQRISISTLLRVLASEQ